MLLTPPSVSFDWRGGTSLSHYHGYYCKDFLLILLKRLFTDALLKDAPVGILAISPKHLSHVDVTLLGHLALRLIVHFDRVGVILHVQCGRSRVCWSRILSYAC